MCGFISGYERCEKVLFIKTKVIKKAFQQQFCAKVLLQPLLTRPQKEMFSSALSFDGSHWYKTGKMK